MGEALLEIKFEAERSFGSIKRLHQRLEQNGKSFKLSRLYRIIGGYQVATQEEKALLARFLQRPIQELFRD